MRGEDDRYGMLDVLIDLGGAAAIALTVVAGCFLGGGLGGIAGVAP